MLGNGNVTSLEATLKTIKDSKLDIELLRRDNEKKCMENNIKIDELTAVIGTAEVGLETQLKTSGEKKLECKLGWCSYRVLPDKWVYDDGAIDEIKSIYPEHFNRYVKVTETLIKDNIKKSILSDKISLSGVRYFPQEPKFGYKISGGI